MGIVVQKYGGSSVADAQGIKRVAQRIVATKKAGHDVCVVVSAMGDTTDELLDLAEQVSPLPPGRELDMLLTAGERISMALLAMAIANLGQTRPVVHRQPGRRHHRLRARPGQDHRHHARPDRAGARRGRHRDRRRLPGRLDGHQGHHHARPRRLRHHRRRARRRAATPRSARSTATSTASSPPTRGSSPMARRIPRVSYEEMLEMCASGAKILHLRCVEYARRHNMPIHVRSSFSTEDRHLGRPTQ